MLGGGMTPVLAAGFQNVSQSYGVSIPQVALTTGLYMLGLGLGSVFASPIGEYFSELFLPFWCLVSLPTSARLTC